ncbi:ribonuclease H [Phenylobacterium sp.]|uniref:ribonuclease H n=1 Tax=Phenylobacterium sp. TaxID=1871053 RepID=UPI0025E44C25|nr:ribonuclease H [Phenylobacterium sp.]
MRIWIAAAHDAAHRNGGWAYVRANGEIAGRAGGERRTTRSRMALAGLAAALQDQPAGVSLAVVAPRPDALVLHTLLKPPQDPPADDLDLRAALAKALAGRAWTLAIGDPKSATPTAFAAAWADLAGDKAKTGGAFTAAIPRTNLVKVAGL